MKNSINRYLKLFIPSIKVQCLVEALKLNLFDLLDENISLYEISKRLSLDESNLKILLNGLIFMDLLYLEGQTYKLSKISLDYFKSNSPLYVGDMFIFRDSMVKKANTLTSKFLQLNKPKMPQNREKMWAMASSKSIKQEQILRKEFAKDTLLALKDFPKSGKILDLGCSSGLSIIETIKNRPNLELVLFDYKEVIEVAKENIKNYDFKDRILTLSGDINKDDIGENYDLIWCSHVIYFLKDKGEILRKIYKALKPNGIFVSYHTEMKSGKKFEDNFFYFLHLAMQNRQILKPLELVEKLENIGFKSIVSFENHHDLATSSQITIGRK